jgi:UrcA family protein
MIGTSFRTLPRAALVLQLQLEDDIVKTLPIVFAALCASVLISTTHANTPASIVRERVVNFSDLDLSQKADADKLHRRIANAAHDLCWSPGVATSLYAASMHQCTRAATWRAMAQVKALARAGAAK